eukprot:358961-Chlamydomonas_euryale.AAC.15
MQDTDSKEKLKDANVSKAVEEEMHKFVQDNIKSVVKTMNDIIKASNILCQPVKSQSEARKLPDPKKVERWKKAAFEHLQRGIEESMLRPHDFDDGKGIFSSNLGAMHCYRLAKMRLMRIGCNKHLSELRGRLTGNSAWPRDPHGTSFVSPKPKSLPSDNSVQAVRAAFDAMQPRAGNMGAVKDAAQAFFNPKRISAVASQLQEARQSYIQMVISTGLLSPEAQAKMIQTDEKQCSGVVTRLVHVQLTEGKAKTTKVFFVDDDAERRRKTGQLGKCMQMKENTFTRCKADANKCVEILREDAKPGLDEPTDEEKREFEAFLGDDKHITVCVCKGVYYKQNSLLKRYDENKAGGPRKTKGEGNKAKNHQPCQGLNQKKCRLPYKRLLDERGIK